MIDLSKKSDEQLNAIVAMHLENGVARAALLSAAQRQLAILAVGGISAKDRRTDAQNVGLRELADALGWPTKVEVRSAAGITNRELRYGECHYAWVVMESFTRSNRREPSREERDALAHKHGLSPGNVNVEYSIWHRDRKQA